MSFRDLIVLAIDTELGPSFEKWYGRSIDHGFLWEFVEGIDTDMDSGKQIKGVMCWDSAYTLLGFLNAMRRMAQMSKTVDSCIEAVTDALDVNWPEHAAIRKKGLETMEDTFNQIGKNATSNSVKRGGVSDAFFDRMKELGLKSVYLLIQELIYMA
jgi:hypothetical protein